MILNECNSTERDDRHATGDVENYRLALQQMVRECRHAVGNGQRWQISLETRDMLQET